MTRLVLVRHGRAAAGFDADHDPGLDDVGRVQADAAAEAVAGPLPIVTSPLRRTRETAAAFERRWSVTASTDERVGEIESPTDDLAERGAWLRDVLVRRWSDLDPPLRRWRQSVVDALMAMPADTLVVTHFVAINAAVGAALDDDRVVVFRPDNCSRTVLDVEGDRLRVVELGAEADTVVR